MPLAASESATALPLGTTVVPQALPMLRRVPKNDGAHVNARVVPTRSARLLIFLNEGGLAKPTVIT